MSALRIILVIAILGVATLFYFTQLAPTTRRSASFSGVALTTDMTKHSIPLEEILDGGPGKDGIPALIDPSFTDIAHADSSVQKSDGILVVAGETVKFYPYNIMVWHEIVNDTIDGTHLVITFCPLCGSAIVYEADVEGKTETFGVSGKLYNSNLLMYDAATESLWSQIGGEAVVGERTGEKLALYPSQVVSFDTVREKYPQAKILSIDSGYSRDYSLSPYGDYDDTDRLYFPVSVTDTRLPSKEIMYVVNFNEHSIAFKVKDLKPGVVARVDVAGKPLIAELKDGIIETSPALPGYHTMWFAWAVHHQKDGIVWTSEKQL
jgi:hypothetical protein